MTSTSISGIFPANGLGNCFEEHRRYIESDLGSGVLKSTLQGTSPRPRTIVLGDITQEEALSLGAILTAGVTMWATGDFIPPSAAIGAVVFWSACIDGTSSRGYGRLLYTTNYEVSEGSVYTEAFL